MCYLSPSAQQNATDILAASWMYNITKKPFRLHEWNAHFIYYHKIMVNICAKIWNCLREMWEVCDCCEYMCNVHIVSIFKQMHWFGAYLFWCRDVMAVVQVLWKWVKVTARCVTFINITLQRNELKTLNCSDACKNIVKKVHQTIIPCMLSIPVNLTQLNSTQVKSNKVK